MSNTSTPPVTVVHFSQDTHTDNGPSPSAGATKRTPWRERRYAPYTKTPTTRNLRSTQKRTTTARRRSGPKIKTPPAARKSDDELAAQEIVGKTWHVYHASPLYQLSHKAADLKRYSRILSAHLQVESEKGLAFRVDGEEANLAVFSVLKGLMKQSADSEAIKIELKQKPKRGCGPPTLVLTAILSCVHDTDSVSHRVAPPFTLLPVLIVKGPVGLTRCLTAWLQAQFDCAIHPVVFTPVVLGWMVAMWSGSYLEGRSRSIQLQYAVPESVEGLSHITLDINARDCKRLWDCIRTSADDNFHENEVVSFIKAIETHFYHHFKVKLSAMPLCRVGTAIALLAVGNQGVLKIYSADHVHQVLSHLTEVVMETTLSLH